MLIAFGEVAATLANAGQAPAETPSTIDAPAQIRAIRLEIGRPLLPFRHMPATVRICIAWVKGLLPRA